MMKRSILTLVLVSLLAPSPALGQSESREQRRQSDSSANAYRLGSGDVLEVFVWKEPDLSTTATVRPDGRIALPLAGELGASGQTTQELQERITSRLQEYLDLPVVTVMVKEVNSPQISVLGEVRRPGRYRVAERVTILDAIALGGGFTEFADRSAVVVIRKTGSGVRRYRINVRSMLRDGGGPFYLEPLDTVYVD